VPISGFATFIKSELERSLNSVGLFQLLDQWAYIITIRDELLSASRESWQLITDSDQGYRSLLQVKQFVDLGCNSLAKGTEH